MKLGAHVGCGPIRYESTSQVQWTNIDRDEWHKPDVVLDARKLHEHFGEGYFDLYSSTHALEHLDYPHGAIAFLESARKVLKPGGVARILVPDLEIVAKAYASGSDLKFIYGTEGQWYYHKPESRAERFHFFMTAWSHRIVYDFDLLRDLMLDAGFSVVEKMAINQSRVPELSGRDRYLSESLIVEAVA